MQSTRRYSQVDLDESMASADPLAELEETGHAADKVWQVGHRNMWVMWRYIGSKLCKKGGSCPMGAGPV